MNNTIICFCLPWYGRSWACGEAVSWRSWSLGAWRKFHFRSWTNCACKGNLTLVKERQDTFMFYFNRRVQHIWRDTLSFTRLLYWWWPKKFVETYNIGNSRTKTEGSHLYKVKNDIIYTDKARATNPSLTLKIYTTYLYKQVNSKCTM